MASDVATAGPGPSTLAAAKSAKQQLSLCTGILRPGSAASMRDRSRSQVRSILRKPSLPSLPALRQMPAPVMQTTASGIEFPPLPPLPPYPPQSLGAHRRSAPAVTSPNRASASSSGSSSNSGARRSSAAKLKSRSSKVSFREDVETSSSSSRRQSHGPCPTQAPPSLPGLDRRASVDSTASHRSLPSRPALKRASSSTTSLRPARPSTSASNHSDFDSCRPQSLRYPKLSPAFSRLSDGSCSIPTGWSVASTPQMTPQSLPKQSRKPSMPDASPVIPPTPASDKSSVVATPARKPRAPRSPIPSWSSATCPSLVSSSHRASLASTLTAPSMTSLLLSPPSPIDKYMPAMPTPPSFDEFGMLMTGMSPSSFLHRPLAVDGDDEPDFDFTGPVPAKARAHGANATRDEYDAAAVPEVPPLPSSTKLRLQSAPRIRPRKSAPATVDTKPERPALTPTRASERLLKLQSSLADLRMQRQAGASPSPDARAALRDSSSRARSRASSAPRDGGESTATFSTAEPVPSSVLDSPLACRPSPSKRSPSQQPPPSPTFADLVRPGPSDDADFSGDESDLDLSLPLLNAALRSHVIPSSSRLLLSKKARGDGAKETSGLGWSGSESEEEEFSRTVRRIAARKSVLPPASTASPAQPTRRLFKRPSLPATRLRYTSTNSQGSDGSSPVSGPDTPAADVPPRSMSVAAGRSASRASTAFGMHGNGTAAMLTALVEQKYASSESLPRPKRFVEGWGAPEVLPDDEWPPDHVDEADIASAMGVVPRVE